jgi:hypothetical protein
MYNYLPGFIKQFDPEEGELTAENWTAVEFLRWLELNKFLIISIASDTLVLGELDNAFYCEGVDKLNFAQKCHQQCDDCKIGLI